MSNDTLWEKLAVQEEELKRLEMVELNYLDLEQQLIESEKRAEIREQEIARLRAEIESSRQSIADDGLAITCQSLGQYRAMLLKEIGKAPRDGEGVMDTARVHRAMHTIANEAAARHLHMPGIDHQLIAEVLRYKDEAVALRAEVEKCRAIANQMVGALRLDLPENESTEMLLTHAYHRIVESHYMLTQLSRTLGGGEA